nr:phosphoribosylformylglycinamidine cyclo-ligase [Geodermatophilus normandii]
MDRPAGRQPGGPGRCRRRPAPSVSQSPGSTGEFTYAASGVDIDAGERAVALMRTAVERTRRPEVVGGLGGFAGLFALDTTRYRRPLIASSTDGVGTKIALARQLDRHDTVGIDLVAMVVDDLVACGAEPLFLQDYVAVGKVVPERVAAIVTGIAAGCEQAGAALVGGETAEHGDLMDADEYDLAATAVGVVEADAVLGPERVRDGDVVVAMASSGFHSNGYSLVRRVVTAAGLDLAATPAGLDRPLGEVLLEPTRIYALDCLALVEQSGVDGVHAFAHITGGGLAGNTARVLPDGLEAVLDRGTWALPAAVSLLEEHGVPREESERAFNCGVGMVAVVAPEAAEAAVRLLTGRGVPAWVAGTVGAGDTGARLVGTYR